MLLFDAARVIDGATMLECLSMACQTPVPHGYRRSIASEHARGIPMTFFVREISRPNGRVDKQYASPDGKKFRSIVSVTRFLENA